MSKIIVGASAVLTAGIANGAGHVVVTEIMFNPASAERKNETEWVEIANIGDTPVDMRGWRLDDEDKDDFGEFSLTLNAGAVAVLINGDECTEAEFRQAWDHAGAPRRTYTVVPIKWGSLANTPGPENEVLTLLDTNRAVICQVRQEGPGWPKVSGAGGMSIVHTAPITAEVNHGQHWSKAGASQGCFACAVTARFEKPDIGSPGLIPSIAAEEPTQSPPEAEPSSESASPAETAPPVNPNSPPTTRPSHPTPSVRPPRSSPNTVDY